MTYSGHMETINIAKLKASLSRVIRQVQEGEEFTVLDRKTPVAHLKAVETRAVRPVSQPKHPFGPPQGISREVSFDPVKLLREDRERR